MAIWKGPTHSRAAPQRACAACVARAIGSKRLPTGSAAGGERLGWTSSSKAWRLSRAPVGAQPRRARLIQPRAVDAGTAAATARGRCPRPEAAPRRTPADRRDDVAAVGGQEARHERVSAPAVPAAGPVQPKAPGAAAVAHHAPVAGPGPQPALAVGAAGGGGKPRPLAAGEHRGELVLGDGHAEHRGSLAQRQRRNRCRSRNEREKEMSVHAREAPTAAVPAPGSIYVARPIAKTAGPGAPSPLLRLLLRRRLRDGDGDRSGGGEPTFSVVSVNGAERGVGAQTEWRSTTDRDRQAPFAPPERSGDRPLRRGRVPPRLGRGQLSAEKAPCLFRDDSKAHIPVGTCGRKRMSSHDPLQPGLRDIGIGLRSGDQAKAVLPSRADARAHDVGVAKQMGQLAGMRPERASLRSRRQTGASFPRPSLARARLRRERTLGSINPTSSPEARVNSAQAFRGENRLPLGDPSRRRRSTAARSTNHRSPSFREESCPRKAIALTRDGLRPGLRRGSGVAPSGARVNPDAKAGWPQGRRATSGPGAAGWVPLLRKRRRQARTTTSRSISALAEAMWTLERASCR